MAKEMTEEEYFFLIKLKIRDMRKGSKRKEGSERNGKKKYGSR